MDCCLCEQSAHLFRARNSLCARCFEGAKEIIELSSRLDCVLLSGPDGRSSQLLLEFASADDADNVRYRPDSHGLLVVSGSGAADHQSANNANNSSSSSSSKQNHTIKPENLSSSSRRTYSTSRLPTPSNSITKSFSSTTTPRTKVYMMPPRSLQIYVFFFLNLP